MKKVATYLPVIEPSWVNDPKVLKKYKLNFNPEIGKDIMDETEDPYFMNRELRNEFAYAGEESNLPAHTWEMPGYKKEPTFPSFKPKRVDPALALTGLGLAATVGGGILAGTKNKKLSDIGVATFLGGIGSLGAGQLYDKYIESPERKKLDEYYAGKTEAEIHNQKLEAQLNPLQAAYKADYQKRYDKVVTPEVFSNLNTLRIKAINGDKTADVEYQKQLGKFRKSLKPHVRTYEPRYWEKQKTASIKDQLSDTVYKPKDPYLQKFYTGEISPEAASRYIDKQKKDIYAESMYFPSYNNRPAGDFANYEIKGKHQTAKNLAIGAMGLGLVSAFPSMLATPFSLKPLAASAGLMALGHYGSKLIPDDPKDIQERNAYISTDKEIQDFELDQPVHSDLLSAQRVGKIDDTGYFKNEKDEQSYLNKHIKYRPGSSIPYVRSFKLSEKTAALADVMSMY